MKIFISWSGARSRAIAEALNDWLKRVIQAVEPFYSPEIEKGAKWSSEIDTALEGTKFGIVCLTPDNLESRWIHYEAGALSKTPDALIWTFLHGLNAGDVPQPLGKFQHTQAQKDDVLALLRTINKRLADVGGRPLDGAILTENFDAYWPKLEEKLVAAEKQSEQQEKSVERATIEKPRNEREILLEILEIVRSQQRIVSPPSVSAGENNDVRIVRLYLPPNGEFTSEMIKQVAEAFSSIPNYPGAYIQRSLVNDFIEVQFESSVPFILVSDIVNGLKTTIGDFTEHYKFRTLWR